MRSNREQATQCRVRAWLPLAWLAFGFSSVHATECSDLAKLKLDVTTITGATVVAAGTFNVPPPPGTPAGGPSPFAKLPQFCRVSASIKPSADSDIKFEVWLPLAQWNGKFQGVGNGGLGGVISYPAMAEALADGYATASTDTGHSGAFNKGDWALGHPQKVLDFGHRAVHEMTLKAKAITAAFYGNQPQHSYWNGCSEGGHQGLSEAQRYPDDYDGIVAGAPANFLTHLQTGGNWISHAVHDTPASFVAAEKILMVNRAVLAACDAKDGVTDGVLDDPRRCGFDIKTLQCKAGDAPDCLTAAQVEGLAKVYSGAKNPRTGEQLFPGYMLGSEAAWPMWIVGTQVPPMNLQHGIQEAFFKYFVFEDANYDWKRYDFDKDMAFADSKLAAIVNATSPDLSKFKARGGKLLQYHGWNDPAISPLNSINYFESVQRKMSDTSNFYRLFMMPGMEHCGGGPGPDQFDKVSVLAQWVEKGIAPEQIVAARVKDGATQRTRPLCRYGKVAKYKGSGSTDAAANFSCVAQ